MALRVLLLLVAALCLGQTRVWGFAVTPQPASGVFESVTPSSIGENYDGCPYDVSDSLLAAKTTSDVLLNSTKQLQRKFKHAADFGVTGTANKANSSKFSSALNQHINSPGVKTIQGTYRRGNPVTHHVDPSTGLNVMSDSAGNFISRWKLNPAQLENVLSRGSL